MDPPEITDGCVIEDSHLAPWSHFGFISKKSKLLPFGRSISGLFVGFAQHHEVVAADIRGVLLGVCLTGVLAVLNATPAISTPGAP